VDGNRGSAAPRDGLDQTVAAAREGSVPAFEDLYAALAGSISGYLRSHGMADVDGLTNEVMAQVHRGLSTFEGDTAQFRAWVFTIAHHRMVDERRRTSRRPVLLSADVSGERDDQSGGDVEQEALGALADERLRSLLGALSEDQRDVLLLRVVADLSLEDVAASLGKTVGAVKSLQHRGLASLRRLLEREGSGGS
jgi:RNA polymerase sigma factor (sigma-70 family)